MLNSPINPARPEPHVAHWPPRGSVYFMDNALNVDWPTRHVRQGGSAHLVIYDNNFPLGSGARSAKHRWLTQTNGKKMSPL